MENQYVGCRIADIRFENGTYYASVFSASGQLMVCATLDYCVEVVKERLPRTVAPCIDCGSTLHRTGQYHCPEVNKDDCNE